MGAAPSCSPLATELLDLLELRLPVDQRERRCLSDGSPRVCRRRFELVDRSPRRSIPRRAARSPSAGHVALVEDDPVNDTLDGPARSSAASSKITLAACTKYSVSFVRLGELALDRLAASVEPVNTILSTLLLTTARLPAGQFAGDNAHDPAGELGLTGARRRRGAPEQTSVSAGFQHDACCRGGSAARPFQARLGPRSREVPWDDLAGDSDRLPALGSGNAYSSLCPPSPRSEWAPRAT